MSETTQTGREPQVFRVALLPRLLFAAVYGALFMIVVGCVSIAHMGSVLDIYTFELFADLVIGSVVAFILAAAAGHIMDSFRTIRITSDGIERCNAWRRLCSCGWEQVQDARILHRGGLNFLRLASGKGTPTLRLPLFVKRPREFHDALMALAPENSPVRALLRERPSPGFLARISKACFIIASLAVFLALTVLLSANWIASYRLKAELARLKAGGAVLTASDIPLVWQRRAPTFDPPTPPDGSYENSAAHFLITKLAGTDGPWPFPDAWDLPKHVPWKGAEWTQLLASCSPEEDAKIRDLAAEYADKTSTLIEVSQLPPSSMADVVTAWAVYGRPLTVPPFPNLFTLRSALNLILLRAFLAYKDGQPEEAVKICRCALAFANHVQDLPSVAVACRGISLAEMALRPIAFLNMHADLSGETLRPLLKELVISERRDAFAHSMEYQRYVIADYFRRPCWPEYIRMCIYEPFSRTLFNDLYWSRPFSFWRCSDELAVLHAWNGIVELADLPFYQARERLQVVSEADAYLRLHPLRYPASVMIIDGVAFAKTQAVHEATMRLARVTLTLRQYELCHRECPDALDELVPEYMDSVPLDPFSGEPLLYRPQEDGFLLYSIGRNLKDDGGRPDEFDGDWIWPMKHRPR